MTPPLLTAADVAARLRVSRSAAYREMRCMQHVVLGRGALPVTEAALAAYLDARTRAAPVAPLPTSPAARPRPRPPVASAPPVRPVQPRTKPRK